MKGFKKIILLVVALLMSTISSVYADIVDVFPSDNSGSDVVPVESNGGIGLGTAVLIIPAILLIAIAAAYRTNFLLAFPLSLMTCIGGGALVINLMMGLTRLLML